MTWEVNEMREKNNTSQLSVFFQLLQSRPLLVKMCNFYQINI